jgi:hypothetical protein
MSREAMQLALEALEKVITAFGSGLTLQQNAITALRRALVDADDTSQERVDEKAKREHEWVGLTDEEHDSIKHNYHNMTWTLEMFARAVEQALKEKNT